MTIFEIVRESLNEAITPRDVDKFRRALKRSKLKYKRRRSSQSAMNKLQRQRARG